MDTNEVNHCNKCGNQWKKYELNYKHSHKIIASWMDDIQSLYKSEYTYGEKTCVLLKEFYAETIWFAFKEDKYSCYYSTREGLKLSFLRKKFKSIYDEKS